MLGTIYTDSLTLDALGRTIRAASGTRANLSPADTTYFHYAGLGAVLARERIDGASRTETEEFRVDAFGNVLASRAGSSDLGGPADARYSSYAFVPGGGGSRGLLTSRATNGAPVWERELLTQGIDADGNIERSQDQLQQVATNMYTLDTPTRQYYAATRNDAHRHRRPCRCSRSRQCPATALSRGGTSSTRASGTLRKRRTERLP